MKSFVEYHIKESNPWRDVLVISKSGNSSGKNKYWLSVKDCSTGSLHSLDFENINK